MSCDISCLNILRLDDKLKTIEDLHGIDRQVVKAGMRNGMEWNMEWNMEHDIWCMLFTETYCYMLNNRYNIR